MYLKQHSATLAVRSYDVCSHLTQSDSQQKTWISRQSYVIQWLKRISGA